jgi:hypothetical protein
MMNQIIALNFFAYVSNKEMFGRGDRVEQPVSNGHGGGGHVAEGTPIPLSTSSHESLFRLLIYGYIWFYFTGKLEEHITKAITQQ